MNVIITNLSTLRNRAEENTYCSDLGDIRGIHTNDAPVTYLLTLLAREKAEGLIRIVAVTTPEAKEAYAVFEKTIEAVQRSLGVSGVELCQVEMKQMAETVHEVVTLIPKDAHVYIDTTGGFRNSSYLLMAVVRILEYSGIRLEMAVYSRYEPNFKGIEDVTDNYRLFDLISAANSFTEFGNSWGLSAFFHKHGHPELQDVLAAMNDFSEAVALCRTAGLDEILDKLNERLVALDTLQTDDENEIMFRSISGVIRKKFGLEDGCTKAEYPVVISWCLEHQLVQQAVTIYTEKIGTYLFQNGFLTSDEEVVQELLTSPNHFDLHYRLFYERFMAMPVSYASDQTPIGRFLTSIKDDPYTKETIACCDNTEQFLRKMPSFLKALGNEERQGLERVFRLKRAVFGSGNIRLHPNAVHNHLKNFPDLQNIPGMCNANTCIGFLNQIITNAKLHSMLQGDYVNPVHVYGNHHINTIEYLEDALKEQSHFTLHIDVVRMQTIMRDYLYIKNFLRNSFNHASDKNDRNEEEMTYFQAYGYPIHETAALHEIISVMQSAVQHCKEAKT